MAVAYRPIPIRFDVENRQHVGTDGRAVHDSLMPYITFTEKCLLQIQLVDRNNAAWTGLAACTSFDGGLDIDFDADDGEEWCVVLNSDVNVSGDWASVDVATGIISVRLDAETLNFQTGIANDENNFTTKLQLCGYASGDLVAAVTMPFYTWNRMVYLATPPSTPSNYYTKAEADVLLALLADKVGTDDIEITDATKGFIVRHSDGTRIRITIYKDGSDYVLDSEVVV